jgi:hypothetical protein
LARIFWLVSVRNCKRPEDLTFRALLSEGIEHLELARA